MRAVLLIDHGSRATDANRLTETFGAQLALTSARQVYVAHMELAEPTIAQQFLAAKSAGYTHLEVLPLFFATGRHMRHDIPALLSDASAASGLPYTLGPAMLEDQRFLAYCAARVQLLTR